MDAGLSAETAVVGRRESAVARPPTAGSSRYAHPRPARADARSIQTHFRSLLDAIRSSPEGGSVVPEWRAKVRAQHKVRPEARRSSAPTGTSEAAHGPAVQCHSARKLNVLAG